MSFEEGAGFVGRLRSAAAEHLILSDGWRSIRMDVVEGSTACGPVRLQYLLSGLELDQELLAIRRFLFLWRNGRFSRSLHPPPTRASRLVLMLRTLDALGVGATQREIAACLLSADASARGWRIEAPSLRSRVQRLTRSARDMSRNHSFLLG